MIAKKNLSKTQNLLAKEIKILKVRHSIFYFNTSLRRQFCSVIAWYFIVIAWRCKWKSREKKILNRSQSSRMINSYRLVGLFLRFARECSVLSVFSCNNRSFKYRSLEWMDYIDIWVWSCYAILRGSGHYAVVNIGLTFVMLFFILGTSSRKCCFTFWLPGIFFIYFYFLSLCYAKISK